MSTLKVTNLQKLDGSQFPVGKVGQMVSATNSTAQTTTSSSYVATSLAVNITPSSTNSKIYIISTSAVSNNNTSDVCRYSIMRDSTVLSGGSMAVLFSSASNDIRIGTCVQFLDSPSTTSQITYALGHRTGGVATSTVNKNGYTGSITAIEVLA